ncbi:MAG: hypothetical protein IPN70_00485 [Candidatus Moraniibacteriota bacterium]|nr:MAG: hypothetical protein IPN70_00485 [Candidatus Moranbacteria bacterium]
MKTFFSFLLFVFIFSLSSFIWKSTFFRYEGTIVFLFIPQSLSDLDNTEKIVENLSVFSQTKNFISSVTKKYPQLKELIEMNEQDDEYPLKKWEQRIHTQTYAHTLRISSYGKDEFETRQLLYGVANTFLSESGKYYDTQDRFALHILEPPYIYDKGFFFGFWMSIFLASLMVFLSSFLSKEKFLFSRRKNLVWESFEANKDKSNIPQKEELSWKNFWKKKEMPSSLEAFHFLDQTKKYILQQREDVKKEEETFLKEETPSLEKSQKKIDLNEDFPKIISPEGHVPINLPIADDDVLEEESLKKELLELDAHAMMSLNEREEKEPSNEEYKRRLNDLLRGKMI